MATLMNRHYSLDPLLERAKQCYHWSYTSCAQHLIQQAKISWGIYFQKCTASCFERAWFVEGGLWINDDPAYFSSAMSSVLHGVCNGVCKQGTRCDPVLLDSNENPSPNDFLQLMTYRYMYPQEQSCHNLWYEGIMTSLGSQRKICVINELCYS